MTAGFVKGVHRRLTRSLAARGEHGEAALWHLVMLALCLAGGVLLAATNPTMDAYLAFIEIEIGKALERSDLSDRDRERSMVRAIFRAHSHELVSSVIAPHTLRHNYGLFSLFETTALDTHVEAIGVGTRFIPIKGVDDAVLRFGRLAF